MRQDVNPALIDILYENLPYRSLQNHALVSGDHLYHLVPSEKLIYTKPDFKVPDRTTEPDGTDMEKLRRAGRAIWKACNETKQVIEVVVWDTRNSEPKTHIELVLERTGRSAKVQDLVAAIHEETELSWSGISQDLSIVHAGLASSQAGSKGSYFATMVFINGEIRPLGYNILNNILKIAAAHPTFDLEQLVALYDVFATIPAEFVGYTGANYLYATHQTISGMMQKSVLANRNKEDAREDFLAMVSAFAKYVNLLNAQNLHMFPWKHTKEYQICDVEQKASAGSISLMGQVVAYVKSFFQESK